MNWFECLCIRLGNFTYGTLFVYKILTLPACFPCRRKLGYLFNEVPQAIILKHCFGPVLIFVVKNPTSVKVVRRFDINNVTVKSGTCTSLLAPSRYLHILSFVVSCCLLI